MFGDVFDSGLGGSASGLPRKRFLTLLRKYFRHSRLRVAAISMALIKSASLTALIGASVAYWRHPESRFINLFQHSAAEPTPLGTKEQAKWRREFEAVGEAQLRDGVNRDTMPFPEPKREFALRWLREQETAKALREQQLYRYVQWTFWAAGAAVLVGIIGVLAAVLHR